jgi:hypothetical protein
VVEPVHIVDVREGGPAAHARQRLAQARVLRAACLGWLPCGGFLARLADPLARWWLARSGSPLLEEIGAIARSMNGPGVWLLHCAYAVGCTASVDESKEGPILRRTLDWPFPGLGRLVEVARQQGPAGEYFNVTWPGFAGVLTAMAPGRFAASINQAPMRQRTSWAWLLWLDYALNAANALLLKGLMPPEHLLRVAFDTCSDFDAVCRFLATARIARPAIFLVAGLKAGERALIEHYGDQATLHRDGTVAANAWQAESAGWRPRVCGDGAPAENNRRRTRAMADSGAAPAAQMDWAKPPVVNAYTRTAVEMSVARGRLIVAGWESDGAGASRVTAVTEIPSPLERAAADDRRV